MNCKYFLLAITSALMTTSCGHFHTKSNTYDSSASAMVNGAKISSGIKPLGGKGCFSLSAMVYMAGSAKLEGPFRWRIEAEGNQGEHQHLVVHRLKVETSKTKRKEWYDQKKLGYRTKFVGYKKEQGKSFAVYEVPGQLKVYPEKDGDITIFADVTVKSTKRSERKIVKFHLPAEQNKKETEFMFLPAEIVKGFGQQDPREWKYKGDL